MRILVTSLCLAAVLSAGASASVSSVSTLRLTSGASMDVAGSEFAVPVRAWLQQDRKRIRLRVARGATSQAFRATLARFPAGSHGDFVLSVRGRGTRVPQQFAGLTIERPAPTSVMPATAGAGEEITIEGAYFGARRGRVKVGDRRARITTWTENRITAVVPSGVTAGLVFVTVANRTGPAETSPVLTID
jgi:hypothetical protein